MPAPVPSIALSPAVLARLPAAWTPARPDPAWHRDPRLQASLASCREVTRRHARSFFFSSFPLPPARRHAACAVYAFCRYADDLLDRRAPGDPDTGFLGRLEAGLAEIEAGRSALPFAPAFAAACREFALERQLCLDLVAGVCMDERPARMRDFAELEVYCYHVASVVGLMMGKIFGLRAAEGVHRAVEMGIAMQLTNILRDVAEDLAAGRIYLPADELAAAGVTEDDLRAGRVTPRWREFLARQIARARAYYASAERGLPLLDDDGSRTCATLMSRIYAGILGAIERRGGDVFCGRAGVPTWRKVAIATRTCLFRA